MNWQQRHKRYHGQWVKACQCDKLVMDRIEHREMSWLMPQETCETCQETKTEGIVRTGYIHVIEGGDNKTYESQGYVIVRTGYIHIIEDIS